jgi:hypothetical protein
MMFDLNLNNRIDPFAGRYTPESSDNGHGLIPPKGSKSIEGGYASSSGANAGHTPPIPFSVQVQHPPSPPLSDPQYGLGGTRGGLSRSEDSEHSNSLETSTMEMGGGSDEMLMTLLAGQAAVDCARMPIGGWEEVDSWKKVSFQPKIRISRRECN